MNQTVMNMVSQKTVEVTTNRETVFLKYILSIVIYFFIYIIIHILYPLWLHVMSV